MDLQLEGKKAVVTGGSRGIGKAIARQLAQEGCDVAICARTEGPLRESAQELSKETGRKVVPIVCDVMDSASIKTFIDQAAAALGGIHILVNSAARIGGTPGTIESVIDTDVIKDFEEKVVGYLRCSQAALPYMKQAGWGRIIHISGGAGRAPGMQVSGGIRNAGTINLTKSMSNGLGAYGINVNAIYPGMTLSDTTMQRYTEQAAREGRTVESILEELTARTPNRHLVTAEDVAAVTTFLCSPLAAGITGEAIAVMSGSSADVHF